MATFKTTLAAAATAGSGGVADFENVTSTRPLLVTVGFGFGTVMGTVTFSDNTTLSTSRDITEIKGVGDTFFGFTAPTGLTITKLSVAPGTTNFSSLDDLGFITSPIPEPAALSLLAAAGLLGRRRRR